ncbi:hypothetical protein [Streptomyces mutabilis]|nr:hypothetical protein [Streptomyces mutabilis]
MNQETQAQIDRLAGVLSRLSAVQREADLLLTAIAESGDRGSKAALCRLLDIKPQSLDDRLTAARKRITAGAGAQR